MDSSLTTNVALYTCQFQKKLIMNSLKFISLAVFSFALSGSKISPAKPAEHQYHNNEVDICAANSVKSCLL